MIWHFIPHSVVNCRYSLYSPGKFVCVKKMGLSKKTINN
ncbi:hypothetical protein ECEC1738_2840 [Escherichia coli EC1738]|nr:hypothetical protein ECEC1738_2840 [Escherichia coli EC1738]